MAITELELTFKGDPAELRDATFVCTVRPSEDELPRRPSLTGSITENSARWTVGVDGGGFCAPVDTWDEAIAMIVEMATG